MGLMQIAQVVKTIYINCRNILSHKTLNKVVLVSNYSSSMLRKCHLANYIVNSILTNLHHGFILTYVKIQYWLQIQLLYILPHL
jgi:hypothetical protein